MSTADLPRELASSFPFAQGKDAKRPRSMRLSPPTPGLWVMLLASTVALISSGYLAWSSLTSSPVAGCGSGGTFDCGHVLHSRWSTVLTLPVSVPAMATHLAVLTMLVWRPVSNRLSRIRWSMLGFAALAAGGAAIWFIGLQVFLLQHLCPYCLVAHVAGIILAVSFWFSRPTKGVSMRWIGVVATASLAGLIGLQSLNETPSSFEIIEHDRPAVSNGSTMTSPSLKSDDAIDAGEIKMIFDAPSRQTSRSRFGAEVVQLLAAFADPAIFLSGQVGVAEPESPTTLVLGSIELRNDAWPLLGKPNAEMVFVEMFDYTCPHCQRTHQSLDAAREHFGDKLAVITMPVPLDRKCNPAVNSTHPSHSESCELAKLAIAVWCIDRDKFATFHDDLFNSKPSYGQARSKARALVGDEELTKMLASTLPSDYVAKHVTLYQRAGGGTIPKLLFPRTSSVGAVESGETMIRLIEQHL